MQVKLHTQTQYVDTSPQLKNRRTNSLQSINLWNRVWFQTSQLFTTQYLQCPLLTWLQAAAASRAGTQQLDIHHKNQVWMLLHHPFRLSILEASCLHNASKLLQGCHNPDFHSWIFHYLCLLPGGSQVWLLPPSSSWLRAVTSRHIEWPVIGWRWTTLIGWNDLSVFKNFLCTGFV